MRWLADLILLVHCAYVLFVTGGLMLIWMGAACRWRWVRNYWFRLAHLAAISFVAIESLIGMACPLTVWEDTLRGSSGEMSFLARLLRRALYFRFPEWVFLIGYVLFALAVAVTWYYVRPRRSQS